MPMGMSAARGQVQEAINAAERLRGQVLASTNREGKAVTDIMLRLKSGGYRMTEVDQAHGIANSISNDLHDLVNRIIGLKQILEKLK